jgi:hypothetical protein
VVGVSSGDKDSSGDNDCVSFVVDGDCSVGVCAGCSGVVGDVCGCSPVSGEVRPERVSVGSVGVVVVVGAVGSVGVVVVVGAVGSLAVVSVGIGDVKSTSIGIKDVCWGFITT